MQSFGMFSTEFHSFKELAVKSSIILLSLFSIISLSSCGEEIENRGYVTKFSDFDKLKVGQSKEEVLLVLGSPAIISRLDNETWIYAGSEMTKESFFEPELKGYNAIKVIFNDSGLVDKVESKGIEDRKNVAIADETTETGGNEVTFMQQLLGNLGRFNPNKATGRR